MHAIQLENFYRQMFSLEHIHGVLMWGFWDEVCYFRILVFEL